MATFLDEQASAQLPQWSASVAVSISQPLSPTPSQFPCWASHVGVHARFTQATDDVPAVEQA
ncbi:MAG TPA: hypothetical protein VHC69_23845 [Polyangiaceae bacterium]|nr:hypothetical protein [Polyangiaceae bacterium]